MVHHRINEREANPNKHINFVTALPAPEIPPPYSEEDARQLLRALAAQVRPIMKSHGFEVNSLEEYEYNRVFAGRNWNNGETVELVLRRVDGAFVPIPWLLSTLCHELAHIKHMNHGREFQKLWAQLRTEVRALQARGYFGDGYWSSGSRLMDSARVGGQGVEDFDLPEYVCGGAQSRSRPKALKRRRRGQPRKRGPSNHTGAQTERKRKAGARVRSKYAFRGEGSALNANISDDEKKKKGTGFRKKAGSKTAREERALAAEKRLKMLQGTSISKIEEDKVESDSEDSDYEDSPWVSAETDESRRQIMQEVIRGDEHNSAKSFMKHFLSEESSARKAGESSKHTGKGKDTHMEVFDAIVISDSETEDDADEDPFDMPSSSNPVIQPPPSKRPNALSLPEKTTGLSELQTAAKSLNFGRLVQDEVQTRKREALGMIGGRELGSTPASHTGPSEGCVQNLSSVAQEREGESTWACKICTLENEPGHLACSACASPRGETTWSGQHL